jgi:hypothetical protein
MLRLRWMESALYFVLSALSLVTRWNVRAVSTICQQHLYTDCAFTCCIIGYAFAVCLSLLYSLTVKPLRMLDATACKLERLQLNDQAQQLKGVPIAVAHVQSAFGGA